MKRGKADRGHVILIQFMKTGKSAIGRDSVDADCLIERVFFRGECL